jgi:hypothetical protein
MKNKYIFGIAACIIATTGMQAQDIVGRKVPMDSTVHQIKEVVVTAKTKARMLREQAMPITVISMNQLRGTVNSIEDVLAKTAGITIRSSGGVGGASRISVRGLEGKRIGFFIDERPMSENSDYMDINDIPIDMIERIEIYKGVVPAKFGGSSLGGAVNIVIREYPNRYADISYALESFNTHKAQAVGKRNLKNAGIVFGLGGSYTYSDNDYKMEVPDMDGLTVRRDHNRYHKTLLGGSFKATKWWFDKVELEPSFIDTYRQIQGITSDIRAAVVKSRVFSVTNNLKKHDFLMAGLDLDMSTSASYAIYHLVDTAKTWYDWEGNAYPTTSKYGGELNKYASSSDDKKMVITNKLNLMYLISLQHSINFNSYTTIINGYPKDELRMLSIERETQFNSRTRSWVGGLTYDFRTKDDKLLNSLTGRFYYYHTSTRKTDVFGSEVRDIRLHKSDFGINDALRYRFLPVLMGKLSMGYDVRIPTETELLGDGFSVSPATSLMPERSTSVNLGVLYDLTGRHPSNLQLEVNGFYSYMKNMIRFVSGILGGQYQNFGEMRTLGVEVDVKADIFSFLYGYMNATWQDLRDERKTAENSSVENPTKGKRMPNIPYLLGNAGIEFHKENLFGGKGQNTRVFCDISYIEHYLYDFEMTSTGQRRIPIATTIDLGFEHSFLNSRLFISGKVKNLANAKTMTEFNCPLPGRSFGVKLRYVLK